MKAKPHNHLAILLTAALIIEGAHSSELAARDSMIPIKNSYVELVQSIPTNIEQLDEHDAKLLDDALMPLTTFQLRYRHLEDLYLITDATDGIVKEFARSKINQLCKTIVDQTPADIRVIEGSQERARSGVLVRFYNKAMNIIEDFKQHAESCTQAYP